MIKYFLFVSIILTSCSANKKSKANVVAQLEQKPEEKKADNHLLENTSWAFINFLPINGEIINSRNKPTLKFGKMQGNTIQFNGRCFVNSYGGSMAIKGDDLVANADIYATEMASVNALDNQRERSFLQGLNKVVSYTIKNDTLTLITSKVVDEYQIKALIFAKVNQ